MPMVCARCLSTVKLMLFPKITLPKQLNQLIIQIELSCYIEIKCNFSCFDKVEQNQVNHHQEVLRSEGHFFNLRITYGVKLNFSEINVNYQPIRHFGGKVYVNSLLLFKSCPIIEQVYVRNFIQKACKLVRSWKNCNL